MISVRAAHDRDAAEIQRIFDDAFAPLREIYRPSAAQIAHVATVSLERLVAIASPGFAGARSTSNEVRSEIDGAYVVGTVRWRVDGDLLRVIGLAVAPAHQRRGVARTIIGVLCALAAARSCRALALYTIEETGNVPVFERLGFRVVSKAPDESSLSLSGTALTEVSMERSVGKLDPDRASGSDLT